MQIRRNFSKEIARNIEYKPDADVIIKYFKSQNIKLALATVSRRETIDIYINENEHIKINVTYNNILILLSQKMMLL